MNFRRLARRVAGDERGGILTLWTLLVTPAAILLAVLSFETMRALGAGESLQENADDLTELLAVGRESYESLLASGITGREGEIGGALPIEGECKIYPFKGCPKLRAIILSNLRANGIYTDTLEICYSVPTTTIPLPPGLPGTPLPPPPPPPPPSAFVSVQGRWFQEPTTVFLWPDGVHMAAVSDIARKRSDFNLVQETGDQLAGSAACTSP